VDARKQKVPEVAQPVPEIIKGLDYAIGYRNNSVVNETTEFLKTLQNKGTKADQGREYGLPYVGQKRKSVVYSAPDPAYE